MKLNQQANVIYNILKNGNWHCPIEWNYADGHTKRFTDLNRYLKPLGLVVKGIPCDCGRHTGKPSYKRKIVPLRESNTVIMADEKANNPVKVEQGMTPEYLKMLYAD